MGLRWLIESVDESCNDSTTLTSTRPQPDYDSWFPARGAARETTATSSVTLLTNLYHGNITPIFPILELRALPVA